MISHFTTISHVSFPFCSGCGGNYHKRCAYKISHNCSDSKHRNSPQYNTLPKNLTAMDLHSPNVLQPTNSWNGSQNRNRRNTWSYDKPISWEKTARIHVPHTFAMHTYKRPTHCQICKKMVRTV